MNDVALDASDRNPNTLGPFCGEWSGAVVAFADGFSLADFWKTLVVLGADANGDALGAVPAALLGMNGFSELRSVVVLGPFASVPLLCEANSDFCALDVRSGAGDGAGKHSLACFSRACRRRASRTPKLSLVEEFFVVSRAPNVNAFCSAVGGGMLSFMSKSNSLNAASNVNDDARACCGLAANGDTLEFGACIALADDANDPPAPNAKPCSEHALNGLGRLGGVVGCLLSPNVNALVVAFD